LDGTELPKLLSDQMPTTFHCSFLRAIVAFHEPQGERINRLVNVASELLGLLDRLRFRMRRMSQSESFSCLRRERPEPQLAHFVHLFSCHASLGSCISSGGHFVFVLILPSMFFNPRFQNWFHRGSPFSSTSSLALLQMALHSPFYCRREATQGTTLNRLFAQEVFKRRISPILELDM
jgi:hypothetical protein